MKYFTFMLVFFLSILNVSAQKDLQAQQKNYDLMKKLLNQNKQLHINPMDTAHNELLAMNFNREPILFYETDKGKVYSMPPDNMRCLKSEFYSNMPVDKRSPEIYIPNTLDSSR